MNAAVIVAAGRGTRMGQDRNKVLLPLLGVPVLIRTIRVFRRSGLFDAGIVVVCSKSDMEEIRNMFERYELGDVPLISGGSTRQESVLNGLKACDPATELVAIHDAARPLVSEEILMLALDTAKKKGNATVAVPLKDTIKRVEQGTEKVLETPDRTQFRAVQTPQVFRYAEILGAHEQFRDKVATDDAMILEWTGKPVYLCEGSPENMKLTTPEDMTVAEQILRKRGEREMMRIGHGYDVHRLVEDRALILCGVHIPYEKGLLGHSDADVAAHALMDAMLGAAALGDIGMHFPDTDPAYAGADSMRLLEHVRDLLNEHGWTLSNADITIICQKPKLRPYIDEMRATLAEHLDVDSSVISVKATTTEHLGFEGEGLGISTHAVVMIQGNGNG